MRMDVRKWVTSGLLAALMGVLELQGLGIIQIPPVGLTILHIPVLVGTMVEGLGVGLALGAWFGALSMISAYTRPNLLSLCFQNPLVALLPRLCIPVAVWAVQRLMRRIAPERTKLGIAVASVAGTLCNTVLVLGTLVLLYSAFAAEKLGITQNAVAAWAFSLGATNGIPEAAVSVALCVPIVSVLMQKKRTQKGDAP